MKYATGTLLLIAALLATGESRAGDGWIDRAQGAPLQLVGRCDSRSSRWEGGSIFSYCEVSVLRIVHGAPPQTLSVRQRGGDVDGMAQRVTHVSLMEPGRSYLLFLVPDASGSWSPTSKGLYPLVDVPELGPTVGGEALDEVIRELGGTS
jgi:hypothetical protein